MVGVKTRVATRINEIESHTHLTHYHGHALETIKAIKIIRGTLDAAFELNTFQTLSKKARSFLIDVFLIDFSKKTTFKLFKIWQYCF